MEILRKIWGYRIPKIISRKIFIKTSKLLYVLTRAMSPNRATRNEARLGLEGPELDEAIKAY